MPTKVKRICKFCGKEFYVVIAQVNRGQGNYCARKCAEMGRRKEIEKICPICNKKFYVKPSVVKNGEGKFCSRECYRKAPHKDKKIEKICLNCNRKFKVNAFRIKSAKFCSMKCHFEAMKGEKNFGWKGGKCIKRICKVCGKEFWVKPCEIKPHRGTHRAQFCSKRCASIWKYKHMKKKDTSIEIMIERELKINNISYLKQCPVEGIALVDFLLPNKIIIQCDGNYWHSAFQQKQRDINQDFILGFRGFKVYRLKETEIKKSSKKCLKKILQSECLI